MPGAFSRSVRLNDLTVDVVLTGVAQGSIMYRGASKWNNLLAGTNGQVLQTRGPGADPAWVDPPSTVEAEWQFSTNVTMADPGSGKFRTNATLFSTSTQLAVSYLSSAGTDMSNTLKAVRADDVITIQDKANSSNWVRYRVTSTPTNNTIWWLLPVSFIEGGGTIPNNNTATLVRFIEAGGGIGAAGSSGQIQYNAAGAFGGIAGTAVDVLGTITFAPTASTGSPGAGLAYTDPAHTALTASAERTAINLDLSSTKQFAAGALATQRGMRIQAPTYSFAGASVLTTAVTLEIGGAPNAGTNATLTNKIALRVLAGVATGVPLVLQGAASQTANLTEWQDSTGAALAMISKDGYLGIGGAPTRPLTVTVASGGISAVFTGRVDANASFNAVGGGTGLTWASWLTSVTSDNTTRAVTIAGNPTDGATAVNFIVNTSSALANATAKLASFRNATVEKLAVYQNGSLGMAEAANVIVGTTTGTQIATATGQKLGFWGATPVVQQVMATGTGKTVDNLITMLQTLGLCKQS